mmetsp:Transcript_49856/g.60251  ORF Transcript_49856/g.60251 Transcript_49856/m.60251 type:complete len:110 (+) Transcript_49856:680-1009(+)
MMRIPVKHSATIMKHNVNHLFKKRKIKTVKQMLLRLLNQTHVNLFKRKKRRDVLTRLTEKIVLFANYLMRQRKNITKLIPSQNEHPNPTFQGLTFCVHSICLFEENVIC